MNKRYSVSFLLFSFLILSTFSFVGCQKKQEIDPIRQEIQEKYKKYIEGLSKSLEPKHRLIVNTCNEKSSEGGAHPDDLATSKQADIDRLIELRLLHIDPETRRYQLTALGKDVQKEL